MVGHPTLIAAPDRCGKAVNLLGLLIDVWLRDLLQPLFPTGFPRALKLGSNSANVCFGSKAAAAALGGKQTLAAGPKATEEGLRRTEWTPGHHARKLPVCVTRGIPR
jgi:hypothetical protein